MEAQVFDNNVDTRGAQSLFSGIHIGGLNSTYDFDNGIAWEQTRPGAGTILAVAGFVSTNRR